MARMKDWAIELEEKMSAAQEEELIEAQKRLDDYIENCIEQEKIAARGDE
jgi:hypothetical protein